MAGGNAALVVAAALFPQGTEERLLRRGARRQVGKIADARAAAAGGDGVVLFDAHMSKFQESRTNFQSIQCLVLDSSALGLSQKKSIRFSSWSVMIAFFQALVWPALNLCLRGLPRRLWVRTFSTLTLNRSSIARRMSSLLAAGSTSNAYWLCRVERCIPFSVTRGRSTI